MNLTDYLREHRSHLPAVAFGRALARRWRECHPSEAQPTKRMILDNGVATDVKLYFEEDRGMMDALRAELEAELQTPVRPRGRQRGRQWAPYSSLDAYALQKTHVTKLA